MGRSDASWKIFAVIGTVLAALPLLATALPSRGAPRFDPARVSWSRLDFKASKFLLTAHASVRLELVPAAAGATRLIAPAQGEGRPTSGGEIALLTLDTRMLNRESVVELWLDPRSAAALQRIEVENSRKRQRHKTYRFQLDRAFYLRREPGPDEADLLPERWTDVETEVYRFPLGSAAWDVTEPPALLYVAAAAQLRAPGDELRLRVFSKERVHAVAVRVEEATTLAIDYTAVGTNGEQRITGPVEVLRVSIQPLAGAGADNGAELRLLGLEDDVNLYLDRQTRVPVRLSGKVRHAGQVDLELQRAVLR